MNRIIEKFKNQSDTKFGIVLACAFLVMFIVFLLLVEIISNNINTQIWQFIGLGIGFIGFIYGIFGIMGALNGGLNGTTDIFKLIASLSFLLMPLGYFLVAGIVLSSIALLSLIIVLVIKA